MDDKTLVEQCSICGCQLDVPTDPTSRNCGGDCLSCMALVAEDPACMGAYIEFQATRIEALEADNARARAQGQDEGFAAAVQELRDMSARKPLPTLWHAASVLADSLEQSRIPCQALESQP